MRALNLTGKRFALLLVAGPAERDKGKVRWICHCDCGQSAIVPAERLRSGNTRSCGCASAKLRLATRRETLDRPVRHCDCGDHAWAPITMGFVVFVSPCDADLLSAPWATKVNVSGNVYAARTGLATSLLLHRVILKPQKPDEVDHKNRNGLDNRRLNLRIASKAENAANRKKVTGISRYKGVSFAAEKCASRPWVANIRFQGAQRYLGLFAAEAEAALAYDEKARECFGHFARLNFPRDGEAPAHRARAVQPVQPRVRRAA